MDFRMLLRLGSAVVETAEPIIVSEEETYLTDEEVEYMMIGLKHIESEYYPDIPMAGSLKHAKKFLYNIPRSVFNVIKKVDESDCDEILSPLFMIYPLLAAGIGIETQRLFLERLSYSIKDEGDEDD